HHAHGVRYTNHDEAIGTPTYMAPEQARGGTPDGRCDVYALGIVAYHALAGSAPFVGTNALEILVQHLNKPVPALAPRCPDAPWGLVELVERMLTKQPAHRPTASEIHAALTNGAAKTLTSLADERPTTTTLDDIPTTQLRV